MYTRQQKGLFSQQWKLKDCEWKDMWVEGLLFVTHTCSLWPVRDVARWGQSLWLWSHVKTGPCSGSVCPLEWTERQRACSPAPDSASDPVSGPGGAPSPHCWSKRWQEPSAELAGWDCLGMNDHLCLTPLTWEPDQHKRKNELHHDLVALTETKQSTGIHSVEKEILVLYSFSSLIRKIYISPTWPQSWYSL